MNKLLNIKETSEILKVKVNTLYSWVHYKKIPHIKLNGCLCFDEADLTNFINENRVL